MGLGAAKTNLEMWEEVFVSTLEDVQLGVVEFGIVVHVAVSLPDEAAHSRTALWWEFAVEDDDNSFFWARWDDGGLEEEVLYLVLLVQVQSPLENNNNNKPTFY